MNIDLSEVNALASDLAHASSEVRPVVSVVVRKGVHDIERDGKIFAAVDTGNLRNSISSEFSDGGLTGETGPTADYGHFVEDGTSRMAPQPFMGPAVDRNEGQIMAAFGQVAERLI